MQITLDEMIQRVKESEAKIHESPETLAMLQRTADVITDMARDSNKITVLTDYDADGITSAYIIQKTLETLNPECEVDVRPNDRRGSYGLSADTIQHISSQMKDDEIENVIVLDMGTNQIPEIEKCDTFNNHILIIDHHLIDIENAERRSDIKNKVLNDPAYCNCHVISDNDKENAQYCTAGLAYRMYELTGCKDIADEKQNNTVLAIAAIGTASDMVDVLDENSFNRDILKAGVAVVDEATPENFNHVVGYMLSKVAISSETTAHELAFNAGAFLNAGGRMSEVIEENGAARIYKALTAPENEVSSYLEIDKLQVINTARKDLVKGIVNSPEYLEQLEAERFGDRAENNIAIVTLPNDTPHSFAGLVAAKFEESADKAVICLTQNTKTGNWSGSARNPETNNFSLMEFMQSALDGADIDIKYGGHSNAMGVSSLSDKDFEKFKALIIQKSAELPNHGKKSQEEIVTVPVSEFTAPDAISKIKELEPIGIGLQLPSAKLEGEFKGTSPISKTGSDNWKNVKIRQEGVDYSVKDWSYDERAYIPDDNKKIGMTAEVSISTFRGEHVEFTVKFDRTDYLNKLSEREVNSPEHDEKTDIQP